MNVLVQRQPIDQTQPLSPDKINTRAKLLTVKSRSTSVVGSEDEGPVPIKQASTVKARDKIRQTVGTSFFKLHTLQLPHQTKPEDGGKMQNEQKQRRILKPERSFDK